MIKLLCVVLLALPLLSLAPAPEAHTVYWTRIGIVQSAHQQGCTFETAPAKLSVQISDPSGIPYGFVAAWSCSGDGLAVANELAQRASDMQAQAAVYRQAHPIGGTP